MDSKVVYTEEIDDLQDAVDEIFEKLEGFEFKKNTLGILYAEEDADYVELYGLLSKKWDFPIIGCTAMAMFLAEEGYRDGGISLMLLTSDECRFAAGITETLSNDNYMEEIGSVYNKLAAELGNEEKMVISYGVMASEVNNVAGDDLLKAIDAVGNKVPIFGGLASDNFNFTDNRIFCNGTVVRNGLAMALISGDVEPLYVSVNSIENKANFEYEITESECNKVFRLGKGTFLETLTKAGVAVDKTDVIGDYLLSPFVATMEMPDGEQVEVARNLSILDHEDGSGTFLGAMPEGAYLGIGIINKNDVQNAVETAFDTINDILGKAGDRYKTILCTTCAARFLALANNTAAEAEVCSNRLMNGFEFMGYYAFGEFCPLKGKESDAYYNMFHNFTFTLVVL